MSKYTKNNNEVMNWWCIDKMDHAGVTEQSMNLDATQRPEFIRTGLLKNYLREISHALSSSEKLDMCTFVNEKIHDLQSVLDNYIVVTGKRRAKRAFAQHAIIVDAILSDIVGMGSKVYDGLISKPHILYDEVSKLFNSTLSTIDNENMTEYMMNDRVIKSSFLSAIDIIKNFNDDYIAELAEIVSPIDGKDSIELYEYDWDSTQEEWETNVEEYDYEDECTLPAMTIHYMTADDMGIDETTPNVTDPKTTVVMNIHISGTEVLTFTLNEMASRIGAMKQIFNHVHQLGCEVSDTGVDYTFLLTEPRRSVNKLKVITVLDDNMPIYYNDSSEVVSHGMHDDNIICDMTENQLSYSFLCGNIINTFNFDGHVLTIFNIITSTYDVLPTTYENGALEVVKNVNFIKTVTDIHNADESDDIYGMKHIDGKKRMLKYYSNHNTTMEFDADGKFIRIMGGVYI